MATAAELLISIDMRRFLPFITSLSLTLAPLLQAAPAVRTENGAPVHVREVLSPIYTIDRIYKSMEGPYQIQSIALEPDAKPELLWVKSVHVDIVNEDGKTAAPSEFMCHMNLDLDSSKHQQLLALPYAPSTRIVTLSQGVFDARVPAGFGFPIVSSEPLSVFTQVLNHNIKEPHDRKVRHRVTIEYLRDSEVTSPVKPLANLGASGLVLAQPEPDPFHKMAAMPGMDHSMDHTTASGSPLVVTNASSSVTSAAPTSVAPTSAAPTLTAATKGNPEAIHDGGLTCLVGARAPNAKGGDYTDPQGHKLVGHWIVPPGKQVNRSDATWFMGLPFDTKVHFALAHLHPFAQSLTLRDATDDKVVWSATATNPKDRVGLSHVDTFTSAEGVPMYKNHKYEIISVYDNPTNANVDSMASLFLGIDDPGFHKPSPVTLVSRASELADTDRNMVVIRTSAGDVAAELYRDQSPEATKLFIHLVRAGAYDHATFDRIDPQRGLVASTGELSKDVASLASAPVEVNMPNRPGTLTWCPGDATFSIVVSGKQSLEGRCTAFGQLGPGAGVIRTMTDAARNADGTLAKPVTIKSIELIESKELTNVTLAAPPAATATPVASLK